MNPLRHPRAAAALAAALALSPRIAPAAAPPGDPSGAPAPGYVDFSYDQVEIRILARTVGMATGRRLVVDESVTGKVTVVTPEPVRVDELYALFLHILESSGYSVVERDGIAHVVKLPESAVRMGSVLGPDDAAEERGIMTKIVKLHHISAVDLRLALQGMVRGSNVGSLAVLGSTNHLLITDTADTIRRIDRIVEELDRPGSSRTTDVVTLAHMDAAELAAQVTSAIQGAEGAGAAYSRQVRQVTEGGGALPASFMAIPSQEGNRVVLVGNPIQVQEARDLITKLDQERPAGTGRLHTHFLNYIDAEEAAEDLNALLEKTAEKDQLRAAIAIEPNVSNNALIVEASPQDFALIKALIQELDQAPQQILVEVLIAEETLGDDLDLGVELSTVDSADEGSTTVVGRSRPGDTDVLVESLSQALFPQGLAVGVVRGEPFTFNGISIPSVPLLITALAESRNVQIRANVPLLAQNNREASIQVVDNVPILESSIEGGSGTARDVIQNIERTDVGIKVTFTPHVNADNEILLDLNPVIEAIVDEGPEDQLFAPTIARREIKTTVTVADGQTVVISGLIRDDVIQIASKVPLLGDIPGLGFFFRRTRDQRQRTNLLVMVTPHLVKREDAAAIRRDLEERTAMGAMSNAVRRVDRPGE
jgi:general secretion pathway protein D